MPNLPEPVHAPDSPTGVRQGKRLGVLWIMLSVSLTLAIIGMLLAYAVS